jgi:intracellular sulfur oxidation DsrE/DsrF family protein
MNCTRIAPLLDAYAHGELDAPTAREVEAHVTECGRCRASLRGQQALQAALAQAASEDRAPASLRARIRRRLAAETGGAPAPERRDWLLAAPGLAALALAGYLLFAPPRSPSSGQAAGQARVVYHVAAAGNVSAVLRTLTNHLDATPGLKVVVVAHNDGIEFLLAGARDESGTEYAARVRELRRRGVEFRVCGNTLTRRQIDAGAVIAEAMLVPSGIAEISRLQSQEGYTYLRL